ncbi:hypothetical protein ACFLYP_04005 [Chloroflexota bacterium]
MKKSFVILSVVLVLALASATSAFAQGNSGNVKGEVTAVDENGGTITVVTNKGETYLVHVPADFDFGSVAVGDNIMVKGTTANGEVTADSINVLGSGGEEEEEEDEDEEKGQGKSQGQGQGDEGEENSGHSESAYCNGEKETPHPMALKIAEPYGIPAKVVNQYYCQGFSMGEIMLALKINGAEGFAEMLAAREGGQGWGQIWQEMGLIGNADHGKSPPGLLKKPDKGQGPKK